MLDINKFEALADKIIETSSKKDMVAWLEKYRCNEQVFINFKSIVGKFKMESENIYFNSKKDDDPTSSSTRYSFAA